MVNLKAKINVIRPTLRHKKRYVYFSFSKSPVLEPYELFLILQNNFEKCFGAFIMADINITVISFYPDKKEALVRVNKNYLNLFLSSLFYAKDKFGLINIKKISSTIKQVK